MKYNPYINEYCVSLPGFVNTHPEAPIEDIQGNLEILHKTQEYFCAITGLAALTTQPVAGAQGELAGIKMFQAYHKDHSSHDRDILLLPGTAHGTNFATASMAGFKMKTHDGKNGIQLIQAEKSGQIDFSHLKQLVDEFKDRIAGIMITNPNTSGIAETRFNEISDLIHGVGGLVYMDGANLNAISGWLDLSKMGVDAVHSNLHKTWSIPHGGGGPGDAIVAVSEKLVDYLPGLQVNLKDGVYSLYKPAKSIGSFHRHFGNFGHKVRCYTYLAALGKDGIKKMASVAVLSARYLHQRLKEHYPTLPEGAEEEPRMHEFILTIAKETFEKIEQGGTPKAQAIVRIGKLFLDFGLHAPTVAFPEVYGLMVEPTESFSKAELDRFADVVIKIRELALECPSVLTTVPHFTPVSRVDEVSANKTLTLSVDDFELPALPVNRISPSELSKMDVDSIAKTILEHHKNLN
jgi:glycine dehydrogenase